MRSRGKPERGVFADGKADKGVFADRADSSEGKVAVIGVWSCASLGLVEGIFLS
jgi:hypothetical protein